MERRKVIVAFGDILGFTAWTRRASNAPEDCELLIQKIYEEFAALQSEMKCHFKLLGDGFMVLRELRQEKSCRVIGQFLRELYLVAERIDRIVKDHPPPRPDGFRVRVAIGRVFMPARKEYAGYPINLAQRLLEVSPHVLCICHESVGPALIEKKAHGIRVERMAVPKETPRGVDSDDLKGLWSFQF